MALTAKWIWRSREPAKSPPDPKYPNGIDVDVSKGEWGCAMALPYPAPGVGSWIVDCDTCGQHSIITAAGRPDDPRSFRLSCKLGPH